mmetsp:Transcript_129917/g.416933  ORF Transcript_129917/g.416933 Transcript_129917/m.416933 type:complete len:356 (-) Transcript_129917:279-1346(-)
MCGSHHVCRSQVLHGDEFEAIAGDDALLDLGGFLLPRLALCRGLREAHPGEVARGAAGLRGRRHHRASAALHAGRRRVAEGEGGGDLGVHGLGQVLADRHQGPLRRDGAPQRRPLHPPHGVPRHVFRDPCRRPALHRLPQQGRQGQVLGLHQPRLGLLCAGLLTGDALPGAQRQRCALGRRGPGADRLQVPHRHPHRERAALHLQQVRLHAEQHQVQGHPRGQEEDIRARGRRRRPRHSPPLGAPRPHAASERRRDRRRRQRRRRPRRRRLGEWRRRRRLLKRHANPEAAADAGYQHNRRGRAIGFQHNFHVQGRIGKENRAHDHEGERPDDKNGDQALERPAERRVVLSLPHWC